MKLQSQTILNSKICQTSGKNHLEVFEAISKAAALAAASREGMIRLIIALLLLPTTLWAEDDLVNRYSPVLAQCYADAADAAAMKGCIGVMTDSCRDQNEYGNSNYGILRCTSSETDAWDGFLNDEYRQTMAFFKEQDTEEAELFPEFANRADALKKAQRAWLAFRDAECELEYARGGSGSIRQLYGTVCFLQMTAKRTIELKQMREFY